VGQLRAAAVCAGRGTLRCSQVAQAWLTPEELEALLREQTALTILDVRSAESRARDGWIPGSVHVPDIDALQLDGNAEVVVYCDCPNDASAAVAARRLKEKGFAKVRPLAGGFDAWTRGGRKLDRDEPPGGETRVETSPVSRSA
jgi:rhodanese-related sulfurtransferase